MKKGSDFIKRSPVWWRGAGKHKAHLGTATVVLLIALLLSLGPLQESSAEDGGGSDGPLRATLGNGLRVVIIRNDLAPVATTVVNYLVGSNESPAGFPGMAHAQEHMMFRGSPGLSADALAAITAEMGGNFDADTQQTVTQYFFTVPVEDLELALRIESIRMSGVLDTEALWRQERGAIEQEVAQDLSNPEYVFYTKLLADLFKGTVYAHDALGTRRSFEETTGAMLKKFYDTWYAPNNAILVIVGDVDPPAVLKEVKSLFSGIPAKKIPTRPAIKLEPVTPQALRLETDQPYGMVVYAFRLPGSNDPDYAAVQVLADAISSQRGSLYDLVVGGEALYAGFVLNGLPTVSLGYAVCAFPEGADSESLAGKMKSVLEKYKTGGVPADLVEAAKRMEVAGAELEKNSVPGLAMAWSRALAVNGRKSPDEEITAIQSVTPEDVNRAAGSYIDLSHTVSAILTPKPSGAPTSAHGFGGTESFKTMPSGPVKLPEWAQSALQKLTVPSSRLHPSVHVLPNGLTLIVQQESVSDTVSVFGSTHTNPYLQVPEGKEGVSLLLDQLFSYGTTSLDRVAFQKALDQIGADLSPGTDFSLKLLRGDFDRGVQLLADVELNPALPESAFGVVRDQLAASVAGRLRSPDYKTRRALEAALLPAHDPALREATAQSVRSLSLQDVRNYFREVSRPDMTVIVVIGKVTPERALQVIRNHFGAWKAAGPKPDVLLPPVPPNGSSSVFVPNQSRVQDSVTLAETLGLTRDNPDRYALQLGNHVLGGAFYATRLYRDLREKEGLVYYVSSSFDIGQTRSFYSVDYACDPKNVEKAKSIVESDLDEMQKTPVSQQELLQAKALILREIPLSESSVDQIAGGLLSRAIHKLPLDEPTRAARHYISLTAAQVQAAFARWIRLKDLVQVTEGPATQ